MARPKHRTRPGGTYFVTTDTWGRRALFRNPTAARVVEEKLFEYRDKDFYLVHRYVVMPEHLHLILTPGTTTTLEKTLQLIKGGSSHEIGKKLRRKFPVWHAGFTEHLIRDEADYAVHIRYIDRNPVKAGLAQKPEDYPYCSAHGKYALDEWPLASGAKALSKIGTLTAGLKPRPSASQSQRRVHYFAYGSNLLMQQMHERIGNWHSAQKAKLEEWEFCFNKAKINGTSAANVEWRGRGQVWGVIYEITAEQLQELEGFEKGYHVQSIEVVLDNGSPVRARTFVADFDKVNDDLVPARGYIDKILHGAREHGLPKAYIDEIVKKSKQSGKGGA